MTNGNRSRRVVLAGASLLACVLLATACEDKPQKLTSASSTGGSAGPATGRPRTGGTVTLPTLEPEGLNPLLQQTFDVVAPLVFEGLVGLDARLEPQPRLAERWDVSPDGKQITFQLRKGVTWHDGKPFSSADVAYTVEQVRTATVPIAWKAWLQPIEAIETPDAHTVRVRYRQPFGPALATWTIPILPKHVYEGKGLLAAAANMAPIGTGPFRFVRWAEGTSIRLEANEAYWAGRPYLDRIDLPFTTTQDEWIGLLRDGKADYAAVTRPTDWTGEMQTPEFRERFETASVDESSFVTIAWNCQRKPFADARVRVALAHALDRARVVEDVFLGAARPAVGPFYTTMWGADPSVAGWGFDLARTAALLDEAGLLVPPKGSRLRLEVIVLESRRGSPWDEMFAVFRRDLESVGVELVTTYLPPADFIARMKGHEFDAAIYEWVPEIADPDPYPLLHSSQIGDGANYPGFANPEADRLLEEGRAITDRTARKKTYAALHRLVHEQEPYTFLYVPVAHYAWSRRVHGITPIDIGPLPRSPGAARWWVDR